MYGGHPLITLGLLLLALMYQSSCFNAVTAVKLWYSKNGPDRMICIEVHCNVNGSVNEGRKATLQDVANSFHLAEMQKGGVDGVLDQLLVGILIVNDIENSHPSC